MTALTGQPTGVHDGVMQITKRECSTCQTTSSRPKTSVIRRRPLLKSTGKAYLDCS